MRKEDIKIGMKVSISEEIFSRFKKGSAKLENCFTVKCPEGYGCYILESEIDGVAAELINTVACEYFEPYEVTEYTTTFGKGTIETNDPTIIEIAKSVCQLPINAESSWKEEMIKTTIAKAFEPITQEFIEGFGFAKSFKSHKEIVCRYDKLASEENGITHDIRLLEIYPSSFSLYKIIGIEEIPLAIEYTCTTQSELRFLLTKGRIDCSK